MITARYAAPRASIDPDRSKSWVRRAMPIVLSHRALFLTALAANLSALAIMVVMPRIVGQAIDVALVAHHGNLSTYVWLLVVLGLARAAIGYVSRSCIFRVAYAIEYDFRTIMYDHLTRLSFSFYDRVQSGQLISRANSDIRALQTFDRDAREVQPGSTHGARRADWPRTVGIWGYGPHQIRLIENPSRRCGSSVAFRDPDGLAHDPSADLRGLASERGAQPVGSRRGVARKRRERRPI